jgi:hypothetical protein
MRASPASASPTVISCRTEVAALFIREGLKVRAAELDRLRDALRKVDEAEERLREKAEEIFTTESPSHRYSAGPLTGSDWSGCQELLRFGNGRQ